MRLRWWRNPGILVPCLGVAALGTVFSMYDVVWPLYLAARGNSTLVIGITISLFAVPLLILARPGGRLADRSNRRWLMVASFAVSGGCAAIYPALHSLGWIIALGVVEACAYVLVEPTMFAVIGDSSSAEERGRAMGIGGLFQFGGMAFGALVLGALYGVGEGISFWGAAGVLIAAAVLCAFALPPRAPAAARARVRARCHEPAGELTGDAATGQPTPRYRGYGSRGAGLPTATTLAGRSLVTTEPAPTTVFSPTLTPGSRMAPPPSQHVVGDGDRLGGLGAGAPRSCGSSGCVGVRNCTFGPTCTMLAERDRWRRRGRPRRS